jgi:hypothetical protein
VDCGGEERLTKWRIIGIETAKATEHTSHQIDDIVRLRRSAGLCRPDSGLRIRVRYSSNYISGYGKTLNYKYVNCTPHTSAQMSIPNRANLEILRLTLSECGWRECMRAQRTGSVRGTFGYRILLTRPPYLRTLRMRELCGPACSS